MTLLIESGWCDIHLQQNRVLLLLCLFSVCSKSALLIKSDKILAYSFSRVLIGSKDDSADWDRLE